MPSWRGRQIDILSDGSVTVAGQKWKMKKSGKEIAINRADPATGGTLILEVQEGALRQTIVLTEDMPDMMNNLASATNTQVQAKGKRSGGSYRICSQSFLNFYG